jgi:vacuolar protein sorting-associated protein 13A/C
VDRLSVAISKSQPAGQPDLPLAIAVLSGSRLLFVSRTFDMHVDIALRSLEVEDRMVDASQATFKELVSSDVGLSTHATDAQDLVTIKYTQCQQDSPEFMTVHEGFNKIVDVNMNALNIIVTRGSILVLFDFVLATFTNPEAPAVAPQQTQNQLLPEEEQQMIAQPQPAIEKMRVKVKLNSIVLILNNDGDRLATLELSAADVSVLLRGPTLRVTGRLGNLFIADDTKAHVSDNDDFRKLLQIKGDEVADFTYETYSRDINAGHSYPGYDAHVVLRTGSLQLTFLEEPLHHLLRFLTQFARMKAILDAARMAATNQVAVATKMSYDVAISTPILLFPRSSHSADLISAHLGAITARNDFVSQDVQRIEAGLRSIKLISHIDDKALDMLEDLNLEVKVAMTERIAREADLLKPDVMVDATLQDVKMALTQQQYALLMALSHTVPRTFSTSESEQQEDAILLERTPMASRPPSPPQALSSSADLANGKATVDLLPELPVVAHTPHGDIKLHSATEVSFKVNAVSLDLYGPDAVDAATLKSAGLIRFALNDTKANVKILNDGSMEAELGIRSFRIVDTNYSRSTKWRDIVPASKHHGANRSPRTNDGSPLIEGFDAAPHQSNQLMLSYSVSSGSEKAAVANLTLDTPTLIFSLEPLFALAAFATSPFSESNDVDNEPAASEVLASRGPTVTIKPPRVDADAAANATSLAFRVNVVDARIILLADPERSDSEAIVLSVSQFEMVQQSILVLHTTKVGMALCKMDRPNEKASFLDEMDITLSMDNRTVAGGQSSSIEMEFRPIVLRVSFRDMMLAKSIINRAIELLGTQQPASPSSDNAKHRIASTPITTKGRRTSTAVTKPKVIMARENVSHATFALDLC